MTLLFLMHHGRRRPAVVWAAVLLLLLLAGCATPGERADAYARWLAPWQGAREAALSMPVGVPATACDGPPSGASRKA